MSQKCIDSHTSHLTMTSAFKREVASVEVTLVLLMVQPTATLLMDTLTISNSAVLAHTARLLVMECYASKRLLTSGATTTMVTETSVSDHNSMVTTPRLVVKPVLSIHSLHSNTMVGVHAITATVTPLIPIM